MDCSNYYEMREEWYDAAWDLRRYSATCKYHGTRIDIAVSRFEIRGFGELQSELANCLKMRCDQLNKREEGSMEIQDALRLLLNKAANRNTGQELVWDIVTALRGPDGGHNRLKELTTAKIRKAIGLSADGIRGYVVSKTEFLTTAEKEELGDLWKHGGDHFFRHYNAAVNAIKALYGVDLSQPRNQIELKVGRVYDLPNWGKYVLAYDDAGKMILVSPQGSRQCQGLKEADMLDHLIKENAKDLGRCTAFLTETPVEKEKVAKTTMFKGLRA